MLVFTKSKAIQTAVLALSSLALATGCSSSSGRTAYSETSAPATGAAGGMGSSSESQLSGGTSATAPAEQADAQAGATSATEQTGAGASTLNLPAQGGTNMVIPLHQETVQVGKREVDAGSVRIRKSVRTETVNQPVQVQSESVTIDRLPATGQSAQAAAGAQSSQALGQPFQEQEVVIPLKREEPVVQKQVVPAGNIVAQVKPQTKEITVQSQIRREDVQVSKVGNPQNVTISENVSSNASSAMGGGGTAGAGGQSQGAGAGGGPITDVSALSSAPEPATLAGRQVKLSGAKVQQIISDRLVALSAEGGSPIYVRLNQPMSNLQQGATVNLTGTVHQVPSSTADLGLGAQGAQALQGQSIYVEAQRIEPANQ